MAGQQVLRTLRKFIDDRMEPGVTWVELLPKVLRCIHDTPGESSYSPYEIFFGRHRPMVGLPFVPEREAMEATTCFEKMAALDAKVATVLNELHQKRVDGINSKRLEPPPQGRCQSLV